MIKRLLALYAFSYPYEALWIEHFDSDTIFKPYRIVGLTILAFFALAKLAAPSRLKFDGYDLAFAGIIGGGLLLALGWYLINGTANLSWAASETALLTFSFLIFIVIKHEIVETRDAELLLFAFVAGTVSSVVVSKGLTPEITYERIRGYYRNPNGLAIASAISMQCLIAWALFTRKGNALKRYVISGVLCLFLAYVLLITGSRTPIIAFAISSLAFVVPLYRQSSRALFRVLAFLPIVVGVGIVISFVLTTADQGSVVTRYSVESAQTGSGRFDIWRSAWLVARDHYFIGVGTAQYRYHHQAYVELLTKVYSRKIDESALGVHSDYLNLLTCYGLPLLLVYLGTLASVAGRLRKAVLDRVDSFVTPAVFAIVLLIAVNQIAHNMMQGPAYFTVMGIATGACIAHQRQREQRRGLDEALAEPALSTRIRA
ncbi:MAG TPA: O-antigen ligase domain-containing protein [Polyangiaceae bacterium]|nr:O-antigen ligase domain-containing protein [Polyangiaceae bacterium]